METENKFRFTFRQREFARLYAQGMKAAEAARAAGYAASTAETNAARLLTHPLVGRWIAAYRQKSAGARQSDLELAAKALRAVIEAREDARSVVMAAQELRKLHLGFVPGDEGLEKDVEFSENYYAIDVEEEDDLPNGEPAFDVKLAAKKLEEKQEKEPITIEFVPVGSREEAHAVPAGNGANGERQAEPTLTAGPEGGVSFGVTPWADPEDRKRQQLEERRKQRQLLGKGKPKR